MSIEAPGPGDRTAARAYQLYVPSAFRPGAGRAPLVVSLHGTGANGSVQAALTHWTDFSESLAPADGSFIGVFPDGASTLWFWGAEQSDDVKFLFDVMAAMVATGCVDASRIYVDGWSEGAYMAQRMACADGDSAVDNHGIVLAGVHGYAGGDPASTGGACASPVHTRVLLSQGLDDAIIDPQKVGFPAYAAWGRRYGCGSPPLALSTPQSFGGCDAGTALSWWPISGQGHLQWSCQADPQWHNRGVWAFFTQTAPPAETACR
jgi:polyhydroxybutyrate depolymerase